MKHHHLRALVAIANHGSINAAARALHLTQPAITKAMRELEAEAGVPLLVRNSWGVTLTTDGQALLARARLIVCEIERAEEELAARRGVGEGRLRVGVSPLPGLAVLPQAYARFRRAMPGVAVDLLEFDLPRLQENLRNGQVDLALAVVHSPNPDPFIQYTELAVVPTTFVVRSGSPLADATSFADLQDAEWLHQDGSDGYPRYLAGLFARHGLPPPRRVTRCTSNSLFITLLLESDAVVQLSVGSVRSRYIVSQLTALALPENPPDIRMTLMLREGAILTRTADYFIHCIRESAGPPAAP